MNRKFDRVISAEANYVVGCAISLGKPVRGISFDVMVGRVGVGRARKSLTDDVARLSRGFSTAGGPGFSGSSLASTMYV